MRILVSLITLGALSACTTTPSQDSLTNSGFVTPTSSGTINAGLTQATTNGLIDADGEGFLFQTGVREEAGLEAVAGLLPGTEVTFRPSEGSATYTGEYFIGTIRDIDASAGFITGIPGEERGSLSINVDFASGAVAGQGSNGLLSLSGGLSGRNLSGTVIYREVEGPLDGLIGGDQAFGVFHGNNADLIYAGGFIAERD
jgi:hypothetical protein